MHSIFIESFVSLFIAMNLIGVLPIYLFLVEKKTVSERKKIVNIACITVFLLTIVFSALGKFLLLFTGITVPDFLVASGIVIVILAIIMLFDLQYNINYSGTTIATVPLGTPLLAGPGVLTTSLIIASLHGYYVLTICLILNLIIVWAVLSYTEFLLKIFTVEGMKAISKIASLLLVSLGIMMVRKGFFEIIALMKK